MAEYGWTFALPHPRRPAGTVARPEPTSPQPGRRTAPPLRRRTGQRRQRPSNSLEPTQPDLLPALGLGRRPDARLTCVRTRTARTPARSADGWGWVIRNRPGRSGYPAVEGLRQCHRRTARSPIRRECSASSRGTTTSTVRIGASISKAPYLDPWYAMDRSPGDRCLEACTTSMPALAELELSIAPFNRSLYDASAQPIAW